MKTSFNLIEKAWIPCLLPGGEIPRELGIRDVLVRAAEIREIVDASPLVTASLHRLLLAILHRNFGPADAGCWADLWRRGRFDEAPVDAYLTEWASRFDLFDDRRPFYQVASLDFQYAVPIARLAHELTRDTSNALFNHTASDADGMPPAKAARYLVAHQAFALGGLVSLERGQNPALYKSADAAPLTKGAVCLVKGRNLFETLMLNLHRYNREDASPFDFDGEDLPTWERSDETRAGDRWPRGYLDLLTWQSRRIRLRAEETESGEIVVRGVVIMKGNQFPGNFTRQGRETMLGFQKIPEAKPGQDPWPAIAFREDRALWRDSVALLHSLQGAHERPKTLTWLADLVDQDILDRAATLSIDAMGLSVDRAKVFLWRHERLPVPLAYLNDRGLVDAIKAALDRAEKVASALDQAARILAALFLAPDSDHDRGRQPDKAEVRQLADSLQITHSYWPRLDAAFKRLLVELPGDPAGPDDSLAYGARTMPWWAETVARAAREALGQVTDSLDTSARALKAVAQTEHFFNQRLKQLLEPLRRQPQEVIS